MPHAATVTTTVDLRVGGAWRLHMVENEEKSYVTGGVYREIVRPERLVFVWGAVDGWPPIDPKRPDDAPLVTSCLTDAGGATEMTFRVDFADHVTAEQVAGWLDLGVERGWTDTIDRLIPYVAQQTAAQS